MLAVAGLLLLSCFRLSCMPILQGLDVGVALLMNQGEHAIFRVTPDYAFGSHNIGGVGPTCMCFLCCLSFLICCYSRSIRLACMHSTVSAAGCLAGVFGGGWGGVLPLLHAFI